MSLEEFYKYLLDHDLFLEVLGINHGEYLTLNKKFAETKKQDRTKSTPEEFRLLILMLIKQFNLSEDSIKRMFLEKASAYKAFSTTVMPRLTSALEKIPAIEVKLRQHLPPIIHTPLTTYASLASFFNAIIFAIEQSQRADLVLTSKPRELSQQWLSLYASRSVDKKKKTGQQAFAQMAYCLLYDMENSKQPIDYSIILFTAVFNIHVYHASFLPALGYGKVQAREMAAPLLYSRSQGQHAHGKFFKDLTGENKREQCLLPRNEPLNKVFDYEVKSSFTKILENYNSDGYILDKDLGINSYFSLSFAYSGLRTNAYRYTVDGIKSYLTTHTTQQLIPLLNLDTTSYPLKISPNILHNKNEHIHGELVKLKQELDKSPYHPDLYLSLTKFRRANAQAIFKENINLTNLKVDHDLETNCLDIQFYPNKITTDHQSANYSEGITNVIICFFVGLLNYQSYTAGLDIKVHRRQSFAFNRMTITDTTNMCMRVSMGYEPEAFIPIFTQSLRILDELLTDFNFLDKKDKKLAGGFVVSEKPKGKVVTDKTGIQFLTFMRSTANMLKIIENVETCLYAYASNKKHYQAAFQAYVDYIVDASSVNLPRPMLKITPSIPKDRKSGKDNILVVGLLNNVLKYALNKIEKSKLVVQESESIYLYSHILSKLVKLCHKASFWLQHHTEHYSSHVYAKAILLAEDLIENLSVLDSLCIASLDNKYSTDAYLGRLTKLDASYTLSALKLNPQQSIDVYYTDSGQQALTASIVCVAMQLFDPAKFESLSTFIYPFGKCYFELFKNIKDNLDLTLSHTFARAQFILVDIREITEFKAVYTAQSKSQVVVIDCTHNPCLNDGQLQSVTQQLLKDNRHVVLVESMLKHEQLGLDKFQAGKLIVLSPASKPLKRNVKDELLSITQAAMHPVIASYFTMIYEICRDKVDLGPSLANTGLFKAVGPISAATQQFTLATVKK